MVGKSGPLRYARVSPDRQIGKGDRLKRLVPAMVPTKKGKNEETNLVRPARVRRLSPGGSLSRRRSEQTCAARPSPGPALKPPWPSLRERQPVTISRTTLLPAERTDARSVTMT